MGRVYEGVQAEVANLWQRDVQTTVAHGPFRSGKTAAALDGFVMYALLRGGHYLLSAPTLDQVNAVAVKQIVDNHPDAKRRGYPGGELELAGGAENGGVTFRIHAGGTITSEGAIRGRTLQGAFLDEGSLLDESYYQQVQARCSEGDGGKVVICSNPDAPTHWLKSTVIDRADGKEIEEFAFDIDSNPSLTDAFKQRLHSRLRGVFRERGYYGRWVAAEGSVYPTASACVDRPAFGSRARAVWLSADYGNVDPTHALRIEEHDDGVRYVVAEWRWSHADGGHLTDAEKVQAIMAKLGNGAITAVHIDPSALAFIGEFQRATPVPVQGAANDVLPGIQQVQAMLELGLLKINDEACPALYSELLRYAWQPQAAARGRSVPEHEASHGPDALRYHCLSTMRDFNALDVVDVRSPSLDVLE